MARGLKDLPTAAQVAILATLAVVVVLVPSYFFVYPLIDQRTGLQKQVDVLTAENKKNQAFEQKQTEYQNRISQLQTQLETLRSIVPDEQATDELMKLLFKDAAEAGVHVRTFIAQPLVTRDYYVEVPFKIRVDGTYWGLVNYFDRLAHEQRIISATSIDLGPPAGGGQGAYEVSPSETVGVNCTVTTYFNRSAGAPAAAPKR